MQFAHRAPMLGMDFIKANRETVERAIRDKNVKLDLGELLALDDEARALKTGIDLCRAERNKLSAGFQSATAEERVSLKEKVNVATSTAKEYEEKLEKV